MTATTLLSDNGVTSGITGYQLTGGDDGTLQLQTTTAGGTATTAVTIDDSQNVGIGTSSPGTKLQVNGQTRVSDGTTNIDLVCASTVGYMGTQTNAPLVLRTNDTERMRIDTSGNVGIGTSSPTQKLDVYGTGMKVNNASYVGYLGAGNTFAGGAASDFCVRSDNVLSFGTGGPYERMRIDTNGKLLVGATTGGATSTRIYAYQTAPQDDNNGIIQADAGSGDSASVICRTAYGTTQLFQWSNNGPRIGSRTATGGSPGSLYFTAGNDTVTMRTDSSRSTFFGDVGPGSSGSVAGIFGTGGDIVQFHQNRNGSTPYWYFNTSGGYGVFSDARLKENITTTAQQDSVDFIKGLEVVEFNWKPEYGNAETRVSGFLAQNVLAAAKTEGQKNILTNWETYDENDPDCKHMGLSDHRVIPSVVHALQAAMAQLEAQQALITTLTERLDALEAK